MRRRACRSMAWTVWRGLPGFFVPSVGDLATAWRRAVESELRWLGLRCAATPSPARHLRAGRARSPPAGCTGRPIDAVAAAAGLAKPTLYARGGDKEELFALARRGGGRAAARATGRGGRGCPTRAGAGRAPARPGLRLLLVTRRASARAGSLARPSAITAGARRGPARRRLCRAARRPVGRGRAPVSPRRGRGRRTSRRHLDRLSFNHRSRRVSTSVGCARVWARHRIAVRSW